MPSISANNHFIELRSHFFYPSCPPYCEPELMQGGHQNTNSDPGKDFDIQVYNDEVYACVGQDQYPIGSVGDLCNRSPNTFEEFTFPNGDPCSSVNEFHNKDGPADHMDHLNYMDEHCSSDESNCGCLDEPCGIPITVQEVDASQSCDSEPTDFSTNDYCSLRPRQSGSLRLWEFILQLLSSLKYNPSHIKWINREKREFKIMKPSVVANMWGKIKNNDGMTYEKMSRAMSALCENEDYTYACKGPYATCCEMRFSHFCWLPSECRK